VESPSSAARAEPENDGLQVTGEQGFLSQGDAEAAIQRRWSELVRCYEEAGSARDFAGGPVQLRFFVDAQGRVADVHVLESRLGNFDVERCLVRIGRTILFPRPQGGLQTSFEYSLEFRSSGAQPVVDLPGGALDQALAASLAQVTAECGPIGGEVTATLYVDPLGTVLSVGLASSGPLPEELAACLARSLRRPLPPRPGTSTISRGQVVVHS
jgi:outer membrane biosynthesis protein TonB